MDGRTDRQTDKQTGRQINRQTDRQTDGQTDRWPYIQTADRKASRQPIINDAFINYIKILVETLLLLHVKIELFTSSLVAAEGRITSNTLARCISCHHVCVKVIARSRAVVTHLCIAMQQNVSHGHNDSRQCVCLVGVGSW